MELSDIGTGTKLELERFDEEGNRIEPNVVSKYERTLENYEAVIAAPILEGNVVPIQIGTLLNVYFTYRRENDIHLFVFSVLVKDRMVSENLPFIKVEQQGEIHKVQRREYYRLDCLLKVRYRQMKSYNPVYNEDIPYRQTFAKNLSGGGISLLLEERIEIGKILECEIFNEQNKNVHFFGKVLRFEMAELDGRFKYEAGVAYIRINESDRDAVIKFIFEEQRKLRKKGLI